EPPPQQPPPSGPPQGRVGPPQPATQSASFVLLRALGDSAIILLNVLAISRLKLFVGSLHDGLAVPLREKAPAAPPVRALRKSRPLRRTRARAAGRLARRRARFRRRGFRLLS